MSYPVPQADNPARYDRQDGAVLAELREAQERRIDNRQLERVKAKLQAEIPQAATPAPRIDPQQETTASRIKLWPMLGIASSRAKMTGGWRLWVLAHALDKPAGSGRVSKNELRGYLDNLGVNRRTQRRWVAQAVKLAIIRDLGDYYYLASLGKAAVALGCPRVGLPAKIDPVGLVGQGWKAHVWGAYLATLPRQISQKTKEQITGISPRTQRNYQRGIKGRKILNIARLNGPKEAAYAAGLKDVLGKAVYLDDHKRIIQRLPDQWIINGDYAEPAPKGRSRIAQKHVNAFLYDLEQDPALMLRLFFDDPKEAARRRKSHNRIPARYQPDELFIRAYRGTTACRWIPQDLTGGITTHAIMH